MIIIDPGRLDITFNHFTLSKQSFLNNIQNSSEEKYKS